MLISSEAFGALTGALSLNFSKKSNVDLKLIQKELFFCGIPLILCSFYYNLIPLTISSFIFVLFLTRFNIQFFTYLQMNVEEYILGRVFSFVFTISIIFMPLGSSLFGYLSIFPMYILLFILGMGISLSSVILILARFKNLYVSSKSK